MAESQTFVSHSIDNHRNNFVTIYLHNEVFVDSNYVRYIHLINWGVVRKRTFVFVKIVIHDLPLAIFKGLPIQEFLYARNEKGG